MREPAPDPVLGPLSVGLMTDAPQPVVSVVRGRASTIRWVSDGVSKNRDRLLTTGIARKFWRRSRPTARCAAAVGANAPGGHARELGPR